MEPTLISWYDTTWLDLFGCDAHSTCDCREEGPYAIKPPVVFLDAQGLPATIDDPTHTLLMLPMPLRTPPSEDLVLALLQRAVRYVDPHAPSNAPEGPTARVKLPFLPPLLLPTLPQLLGWHVMNAKRHGIFLYPRAIRLAPTETTHGTPSTPQPPTLF